MDATELAYAGAARQAQMVRDGECSAREVVQATLDRIAQVDPLLNAYRVVFAESALEQADGVDASGGSAREKPLLGVPVPIKDDTDVAGERTAWGSLATDRRPAGRDADMVARLREAGAVIIGKTNVPELTIWPLCESLAFGSTRNPWNPDFTSGGSSGGAGAAAAAGLCGVAHGSDGAGSVRIPASFNGLFGLKPQRDRISLGPNHHDAWNGLTVYGPLARSVLDAALFMDAAATEGPPEGFAAAAQADPGSLRVAVSVGAPPGALTRLGADQLAAVRETAEVLRSLGHQVFEREIQYPRAAFLTTVARYLRSISDDVSGLPHPERLERRTRNMARLGSLVGDSRLAQARAAEPAVAAGINAIFDEADVVLMPGPAARPFEVGELHGRGALWTLNAAAARVPWYGIWNTIGQPAASLPAGFDDLGLPLSAQLGGRPGDEVTLLQLAWQVEQAGPWVDRRPPLEPAFA